MSLLLNRQTIQELLSMEEEVDLLEKAFAELVNGTSVMPQRVAVVDTDSNGWYAFMPGQLKEMGALGIKVVTVYKDNPSKYDLPSTLATMVLLDGDTGRPLSIMDGGFITAMRTGGASGLATKILARPDAKIAGVLGTGVQARAQLMGISVALNLDQILCYSEDTVEKQNEFACEVSQILNIPVTVAKSARDVVESVEVLSLATTSSNPIIDGDWIKDGTHINAVGSHTPEARELDTKTVVRSKIVCDYQAACLAEAGDLLIPIEEGSLSAELIYGDLGEIVVGKKKGRESDRDVTLFKSVGLSIQDISTAFHVYQKALRKGVGTEFEF